MKINMILRTLAASLSCVGVLALAGEQITDSTEFQVRTASGQVEKVKVQDLAIGEVRNVTSESGASVVVGRHEGGYVLDIGGERIEVNTPDLSSVTTDKEVVINAGDDHGKQIVIKLGEDDPASAAGAHKRRVVVVKPGAGDSKTIRIEDGEGAEQRVHEMDLDDPELGDKRVIVVRKVERTVSEGQD